MLHQRNVHLEGGYHEKDTVLLPMGICQTIDASYVKHAFWIVEYGYKKDVSKRQTKVARGDAP